MKNIKEYQVTAQGHLFEIFKSKKKAIERAKEMIQAGYKNVFLYLHSKNSDNTCFFTQSIKIK